MALTSDQITAQNFADFYQKILPYLNGGGMGMKLLWENPNPTSNFAEQNITLDSDNYDLLLCIALSTTSTANAISVTATKGLGFTLDLALYSNNATYNVYRPINRTSDIQFAVKDAKNHGGATINNYLIPYRIYGIKVYNRDVPGKTTLLWSNPDPSSAFAAQRITLASSDYDLLCIISSQNVITTQNPHRRSISNIVQKGQGTETEIIIYYQGSVLVRSRAFDYVDDTHLDVSDNTQNGTTNNTDNIPLAVYGIKL